MSSSPASSPMGPQAIISGANAGTHLEFPPPCGGAGASDAFATEAEAGVGGWWCQQQPPTKEHAHWFFVPITEARCSWAFDKDSPPEADLRTRAPGHGVASAVGRLELRPGACDAHSLRDYRLTVQHL